MVKSSGFGDKLLEFKSQLHHLLVVCLWQVTSTFHASLDYSFFFFPLWTILMEIVTVPTS